MKLPKGFKWLPGSKHVRCCRHARMRVLAHAHGITLFECASCRHKWKEVS